MKWSLIWTLWSIAFAGSFVVLEWLSLKDKTPGSFTYSEFGWHLMRHPVVNIAVIAFLVWLTIHFVFKGKVV